MSRHAAVVLGVLTLLTFGLERLPAAPVPTHLMPKEGPFAYPVTVGATWVYDVGGSKETLTVSKVEDKDGTKLVTTEIDVPDPVVHLQAPAGGQRAPPKGKSSEMALDIDGGSASFMKKADEMAKSNSGGSKG